MHLGSNIKWPEIPPPSYPFDEPTWRCTWGLRKAPQTPKDCFWWARMDEAAEIKTNFIVETLSISGQRLHQDSSCHFHKFTRTPSRLPSPVPLSLTMAPLSIHSEASSMPQFRLASSVRSRYKSSMNRRLMRRNMGTVVFVTSRLGCGTDHMLIDHAAHR